eukprot:Gb_04032 [translate_table: standard]
MAENEALLRSRPTARNNGDTAISPKTQEEEETSTDVKSGQKPPNALQSVASPSCLGLALALVLVAIVIHLANKPALPPRLWTKEELAKYNGTDEDLPILLSILGNVFDVTRGRTHYGVGGSYNHFAGSILTQLYVYPNTKSICASSERRGSQAVRELVLLLFPFFTANKPGGSSCSKLTKFKSSPVEFLPSFILLLTKFYSVERNR